MKYRINWNIFLRLINKYKTEAEKCLDCGLYLAGCVCVRATLETALESRYLIELWNFSEDELEEYDIEVNEDTGYLQNIDLPPLKELIEQAGKDGLFNKKAMDAAHRIREYGNTVHPTKLAEKLPQMEKRTLQGRLNDLEFVIDELLKSV